MVYNTQKRILIVDDEEDLTWTLSKKLSKDKDKFEIVTANSGKDAIDVLNQMPFDLVISDVRMPEVSGLDLLNLIKDQYPSTKVIIMTAYGSSDVQQEASLRGSLNYIEKPFEINELRQIIIDALSEIEGFKGRVSDFKLSDIIQLNCLGRLSSALAVNHEDEEGMIYFQEGNIVHAESGSLTGENAFYHIMSWPGGEFYVYRDKIPPQESISKGWQSILLESLRRIDENSRVVNEERDNEKTRRRLEIESLLSKVRNAEGVEHIIIHSEAGFPMQYMGSLSNDTDKLSELGNELSNLVKETGKSVNVLQDDTVKFLEIQTENQVIVLHKIPGENTFISVIGTQEVHPGFIRMELKRALPKISKLL
jgi:CheY-like chemotaxis protein